VISTLRIRDLAVVADVELELGPGLNVLTGETGAGKSLVLAALALLAGRRASAEAVRQGASEAAVEAVFGTARLPALEAELAARGLACDDHELVVRRSVAASGRSRAQVAGQLAPVSLLAELLGPHIEIASQHDSHALRRPEVHGRLLDAYGGLEARRRAVAEGYADLRRIDEERRRLHAAAAERARRRDLLAFQVGEIDEAKLRPGEAEALAAERARLRHVERLREGAGRAAAALGGDPAVSDAPGAADLAAEAARGVEDLAEIDPELGPLAGRLVAAHAELADAAAELESYAAGVEGDPARLAEVEERLERIEGLRRKYGESVEEILAFRAGAAAELEADEAAGSRERELAAERERRAAALVRDARALSAGRRRAARRLADAVETELRALALPHAGLAVDLPPAPASEGLPCGPAGAEAPELLFRANPGEDPRPLRKVASGGELSRLFLALKNALRRADRGMVLVFDEVDAGVGGGVAERVGHALAELASEHQVLCITHLPQVAARGDVHLQVRKREAGGRAVAEVRQLDPEGRVEEIARMAGGTRITAATRRHARELLEGRSARPTR